MLLNIYNPLLGCRTGSMALAFKSEHCIYILFIKIFDVRHKNKNNACCGS